MSIARLLALVVLLGSTAAVLASDAAACLCFQRDAVRALQGADAAFIGVPRERRVDAVGQGATYRFEVEEVLKGQLPASLEVRGALNSCGISPPIGIRTGLLLYRSGQSWTSSSCDQWNPDELRRAAAPLPQPDGIGPIAFLVAGFFGNARMLALDQSGRTLGYGFGGGTGISVSVCPGSRRAVETVIDDSAGVTRLAVRDVPSLGLLREVLISRDPEERFETLHCSYRDARTVFVFANSYDDAGRPSRILRVRGTQVSEIYRGHAHYAAFHKGTAVLTGQDSGIRSIDLATGRMHAIDARLRFAGPAAISPGGNRLAVYLSGEDRLAVITLARRTAPRVRRGPHVPLLMNFGQLEWVAQNQFGLFPGDGGSDRAFIFDTGFRRLGSFRGWTATSTIVAGRVAWGLSAGTLRKARLPGGPVTKVSTFFSPETYDLVRVPGAVHFRPQIFATSCPNG